MPIMNIDVKDTFLMNTEANELLVRVLNGDMEELYEKDRLILTENWKKVVLSLFQKGEILAWMNWRPWEEIEVSGVARVV